MNLPLVAWSFSAINDFDNCAYKYYRVRVKKDISDVTNINAAGDDDHKALELYVAKGRGLPTHLVRLQPALDKLKRAPGQIITEGKYALDANYNPCDWRDRSTFVRAITDYTVLNGQKATTIDYKTGKVRKDSDQNALVAGVLFQTYSQLQEIKTAYWFVNHDKFVPDVYTRADIPNIWNLFLPKYNKLVQAKVRDEWPKTPNPLCGWCPVHDCIHNTNPRFQSQSPT